MTQQTQDYSSMTQDQLKAVGKMKDPVTGSIFDLPNSNQNYSAMTADQLKAAGKMKDPVTGAIFDLPKPTLSSQFSSEVSPVTTSDSIRGAESTQKQDQAITDAENAAELQRLKTQKEISDLKASMTEGMTKPTAPQYEESYKSLISTPSVGGQSLNDINSALATNKAAQRDLQNQILQYQQGLSGQGRTGTEVSAASTQQQKDLQLKLITLQNEEANLTDQANIANNYINNVMNFKQMDYTTALNDYNTTFSQNYQVQQIYNAQQDKLQSQAQAYLTSVGNMIKDAGVEWTNVDPSMKAAIYQQEMKAGWQPGTLEAFAKANPKKQIIGTVNGMDSNGNATITFIYQDSTTGQAGMAQTVNTGVKVRSTTGAGLTPDAIQFMSDMFLSTGDLTGLGYGTTLRTQILNQAAADAKAQGVSPAQVITNKYGNAADKASLANLQKQADQINAFEGTAQKNLQIFMDQLDKIEQTDTGIPIVNKVFRGAQKELFGSGDIASFETARTVAYTEIAKVLNNPGMSAQLSDSARGEAEALLQGNYTVDQLKQVAQILMTDMNNRRDSINSQIGDITSRVMNRATQADGTTNTQSQTNQSGTAEQNQSEWDAYQKFLNATVGPTQ